MSKIRVGIIGLSASATGTGWATSAHLPYLLKSPHYSITALCNSSVDAAQKAVKAYNLPASTKAYGSPEDLANDPDVDLVVVSVRVDKHAEVALPSLKTGKNVFCEWPMDKDVHVAREMLIATKNGGGKSFVALQGRQSPIVRKIKNLIESGRIGKVLSSSFIGAVGNGGGEESVATKYFTDRNVGGNPFTIGFGHSKFTHYSSTNLLDREGKKSGLFRNTLLNSVHFLNMLFL
jgi:predicted dehydrogenase